MYSLDRPLSRRDVGVHGLRRSGGTVMNSGTQCTRTNGAAVLGDETSEAAEDSSQGGDIRSYTRTATRTIWPAHRRRKKTRHKKVSRRTKPHARPRGQIKSVGESWAYPEGDLKIAQCDKVGAWKRELRSHESELLRAGRTSKEGGSEEWRTLTGMSRITQLMDTQIR